METLPKKRGRKQGQTLEHVRKRRHAVLAMMLKGKHRDAIVDDVCSTYNVSIPTVDNDLQICNQELRKQYAERLSDLVAINHAKLDRLFEQWDTVDGNLQVKIIDIQNKMAGVYKPDTAVQVNTLNVNLENMTVDELKQLLNGNAK